MHAGSMDLLEAKISLDTNSHAYHSDVLDCAGLTIRQGVLICIGGLGLLVISDFVTDKNYPALDRAKGDGFMIAGATLYGFSTFDPIFHVPNFLMDMIPANATEEFFVRKRSLYEVVGQLGIWGFIINGIQASGMEWRDMKQVPWNGGISEPSMRLFFLDFIPIS